VADLDNSKMSTIHGVDGCKGGWLSVSKEGNSDLRVQVFNRFVDLIRVFPDFKIAAVDIPIGLVDDGNRKCDEEARQLLRGRRAASVFSAPIRAVLGARDYKGACQISRDRQGKAITKQTWAMVKKIREVDALLCARNDLQQRIVEVHPEISFYHLNGGNLVAHSKHTAKGSIERQRLIKATFPPYYEAAMGSPSDKFTLDDLLDACAALWSAERFLAGSAVKLPDTVVYDSMQIVA
jgi:predicted RNase H-like nuclease